MKAQLVAASLLMSLSLASAGAYAKPSCLKGAAAGAVGGHFLGKHHVLGAAVGCAVGHHMSKKQERQEREQAQANAQAQAQANQTRTNQAQATHK
ncbi:hypothetical protein AB595_19125 [Massilia sp. WF1]|uniref:hypothetical protein n=1 Tax=unclassified Massilia TaxID=2609279 RepID=UPI0006498721|nr:MULTISPECIES: hypothetical protein [unclassified Massilia]ALK95591.1 hypothetical protein AM586_04065 [Massilia sp. WG5]KLU35253.1 hypothetical protein AB595_19125 [Massilia sp. WF1]